MYQPRLSRVFWIVSCKRDVYPENIIIKDKERRHHNNDESYFIKWRKTPVK